MNSSPFTPSEQPISEFLNTMTFGILNIVNSEGEPNIKPVNYLYHQNNIYFHGKYGEKGILPSHRMIRHT